MDPSQNTASACHPLQGLTVLERGWLSSNNVLIHPAAGEDGATLVDSGHCLHAQQTLALVERALAGTRLRQVLNTHLHSDHCGGNAALQRRYAMPLRVPAGGFAAARDWDEARLGYADVAQRIERFTPDSALADGQALVLGGRAWEVVAAPGHDPDALMLFDRAGGVLVSGDALWNDGFGVVFPELDGIAAFDDVAAVLDRIDALPVRWVIPGHGPAFADVEAALGRARSRHAAYVADPARHARYAGRVLLKYHLMEEQQQPLAALRDWAAGTPLLGRIWQRLDRPGGSITGWCDQLLADLVRSGAARVDEGVAANA